MPQVPVLDAPSVSPQGLPSAFQQAPQHLVANSTLAGRDLSALGQGALGLGSDLMAQAAKDQAQQNETSVKEFDAKLMTGIQGVLHGTPDNPDLGYMAQRGDGAVKGYDGAAAAIQKVADDLSKNLANPRQQEMASTLATTRVQGALTQAAQHREQQKFVAGEAASQIRVKAALDGAPQAYSAAGGDSPTINFDQANPAANSPYQQYLQTIASETRQSLAAKGIAEDAIKDGVNMALGQAYMRTLISLVDKNDPGGASLTLAKAYYDKIKDAPGIDGESLSRVRNVLDAAGKQDQMVTVQRTLIDNSSGSIESKRKQLGDAFDSGGSIGGVAVNGEIYKYVSAALDHAEAKQRSNEDRWVASAVGQAQDYLIRNPGATVLDLPRNLYVALQAKGHLGAIDAFANRESNKPTDPAVLHNLYAHIGDGSKLDIAQLSETDWANMRSVMSRGDWTEWDKNRTNLQQGVTTPRKDPGNLDLKLTTSLVSDRMRSIGVEPMPPEADKAGRDRAGAIQDYVAKAAISEQQVMGRRMNQDEMRQFVDGVFATNIQFRNTFMGVPTTSSSVRMMGMKASDIPSSTREAIRDGLVQAGNASPTDRDILTVYWSKHGGR